MNPKKALLCLATGVSLLTSCTLAHAQTGGVVRSPIPVIAPPPVPGQNPNLNPRTVTIYYSVGQTGLAGAGYQPSVTGVGQQVGQFGQPGVAPGAYGVNPYGAYGQPSFYGQTGPFGPSPFPYGQPGLGGVNLGIGGKFGGVGQIGGGQPGFGAIGVGGQFGGRYGI